MEQTTIGQSLIALRERSGLSLAEVAKRAGYKGPSSVQAMFSPDYNVTPLGMAIGDKLWRAFDGTGDPPIQYEEIYDLCATTPHIQRAMARAGGYEIIERHSPGSGPVFVDRIVPTSKRASQTSPDIPVFGTALAAEISFTTEGEGELVEQTVFDMGEIVTYGPRPAGIQSDAKVYALYVSGSSMEPRYRPGDPLFVDTKRPPSIGDDVIVQLMALNEEEPEIMAGLIKTLVRRTGSYLELEQYQPAIRFRVPMDRVAQIHRVIPPKELFGF